METLRQELLRLLGLDAARAEKARALAEAIRAAGGFRWIGVFDVSVLQLTAIAWTGHEPPAFPAFPISRGLNGAAVEQRGPIIVQDVSKDRRYLQTFEDTRAEAIFPVFSLDGSVVMGTLDVESDRIDAFGEREVQLLQECAVLLRPLWS